jgi:hypothetical protein
LNNPLKQPAMSLEEAYANAVISDALDTDDEAEVCLLIHLFVCLFLSIFIYLHLFTFRVRNLRNPT